MSTYYPNPTIRVGLYTDEHMEVDGTQIYTADLEDFPYGSKKHPDWLPEDKNLDRILADNTTIRDGDELVIQSMYTDDEIRIHHDNLEFYRLMGDYPEDFGFEDIPVAEDYE